MTLANEDRYVKEYSYALNMLEIIVFITSALVSSLSGINVSSFPN